MGRLPSDVPVHDSLQVCEKTDLYRTDEWWKSVVTYQFEDSDTNETAMYLWHKDDDWTRKNKYVIKTPSAWVTDREIINRYIRNDAPTGSTSAFPVSEYYTVAGGETVFESEGWWKAIVNVVEKGTYETNEVMVYVWQEVNDQWRRRQKYAIKSVSDWEQDKEIIESHLSHHGQFDDIDGGSKTDGEVWSDLSTLDDELEAHLSSEFK